MISPRALALAAALAGALAAGPALAQSGPLSLGEAIFGRRGSDARQAPAAPPIGRYSAGDGQTFVLEQRGSEALMRFDGSDEIWVLRPDAGPRGDLIWRNDVGRSVLIASRLGGMTVFTAAQPGGATVQFTSPAEALQSQPVNAEGLLQRLVVSSVRASRSVGHLIRFEGPMDVRAGEEAVLADAAALASFAIQRVASAAMGPVRAVVLRLSRVRVSRGRSPNAAVIADVMEVTVVPDRGPAGRPSSEKIIQAIRQAR